MIVLARAIGRQMLESLIGQGLQGTRERFPERLASLILAPLVLQIAIEDLRRVLFGSHAPRLRFGLESGFPIVRQFKNECHRF
jgi:hypothetical protein